MGVVCSTTNIQVIPHGIKFNDQIRIVVHGSRKCGKTSLINRMEDVEFKLKYTPTPSLQCRKIGWCPISKPDEFICLSVWDAVDKSLKSEKSKTTVHSDDQADAETVETFHGTDGFVVIYDPRDRKSVKYAADILQKIPERAPTIVLMNFLDERKMSDKIPKKIQKNLGTSLHIQTSLKTNQGLTFVAKWLDTVLLYHRRQSYLALLLSTDSELDKIMLGLDESVQEYSYIFSQEMKENPSLKCGWKLKSNDQINESWHRLFSFDENEMNNEAYH